MEDANTKREILIDSLTTSGFDIREISKKPLLYKVNGSILNIRTDSKYKDKASGKEFWYGLNKNVLKRADYVLYQMVNEKYFLLIPSDFLSENWENFYESEKNVNERSFMIQWDELKIVAYHRICVDKYYCNMDEKEGLIFDL